MLDKYNIPSDEDHVMVGAYRERSPVEAVNYLIDERKIIPDAIICANDIMASAACKALENKGLRVPEDIVVTGFDGMECAKCSRPKLTTCVADLNELGRLIIQLIDEIHVGDSEPKGLYYGYRTLFSETTGSNRDVDSEFYANDASLYYNFSLKNEEDEYYSNRFLDDLDEKGPNLQLFGQSLGSYLGNDQVVILRSDSDAMLDNIEHMEGMDLPDTMLMFSNNEIASMNRRFPTSNMFEVIEPLLSVKNMCVVTGVYLDEFLVGYHIEAISDVYTRGRMLHRHVVTIIKALKACFNVLKTTMLKTDIEKSKYVDSLTGFDNMRGFQRWFEAFNSDEANHNKYFEFCLFTFINHDSILQKYTTEDSDACLRFISNNLKNSHPLGTYIARISAASFVVILEGEDGQDRRNIVYDSVDKFYKAIVEYNKIDENGPQIEVSSGSVDLNPGWSDSMNNYINKSYEEIYKNRAAIYKDDERRKDLDIFAEFGELNKFNIIIRENRLTYFFQPIVSACTGEVVAYEALMRVTGDIQSNPLELLSIAKKHRRLYDIERATFFNVMKKCNDSKNEFGNRLVFINTIPGKFLQESDVQEIKEMYGDLFDQIVVEITEDNTVEVGELDRIRKFGFEENKVRIAIDDYGTGHSNIVNLITYKPDIVKIDRFLVTDIYKDNNKRMLVTSVITFAKNNNIKTLAEGVETLEELEEVIKLGVDYIQGYYTAKPSPEIISEINTEIKNQIINANK